LVAGGGRYRLGGVSSGEGKGIGWRAQAKKARPGAANDRARAVRRFALAHRQVPDGFAGSQTVRIPWSLLNFWLGPFRLKPSARARVTVSPIRSCGISGSAGLAHDSSAPVVPGPFFVHSELLQCRGMGTSTSTPFACPNCGAQYEVVRVETDTVVVGEQITCRRCGGPLHAREGRYILKYFLVDHRGALPKVRRRS
jgi:predicted RNA-binding Zn-ribbon protein involved in translation (DUF1610 family)